MLAIKLDLARTEIKEKESLMEYFNRIIGITDKLETYGYRPDDLEIALKFLSSVTL